MSELVDVHGQVVSSTPDRCPKCGSKPKDHQMENSFGGYKKLLCMKCGTLLKSWRDQHVEEV